MYGSSFTIVTLYPLFFKRRPKEEQAIPFPKDETTPPVKKYI